MIKDTAQYVRSYVLVAKELGLKIDNRIFKTTYSVRRIKQTRKQKNVRL